MALAYFPDDLRNGNYVILDTQVWSLLSWLGQAGVLFALLICLLSAGWIMAGCSKLPPTLFLKPSKPIGGSYVWSNDMSLAFHVELIRKACGPATVEHVPKPEKAVNIEPFFRPSHWRNDIFRQIRSEQVAPFKLVFNLVLGRDYENSFSEFPAIPINGGWWQPRCYYRLPTHFQQKSRALAVILKAVVENRIDDTYSTIHDVVSSALLSFKPETQQVEVGRIRDNRGISRSIGSPNLGTRDDDTNDSDYEQESSVGRLFLCTVIAVTLAVVQIWCLSANRPRWSGMLYVLTILGLLTDLGAWGFGNVFGFWTWLYRVVCGA